MPPIFSNLRYSLVPGLGALCLMATAAQAQTILTTANGIVRSSLCVGTDCQSGISFSDSTLIIKENNTRIKFSDTSAAASFPREDWELEANSQTNGGQNQFAIFSCGEGSNDGGCSDPDNVFTVEAGARSNALYVEDSGEIGIGTNNPVGDIHITIGDTPTMRLEQNTSSGFSAQSWDLAGNETNFFLRDVTNGSALPFRVRPGAPTSSIDVASDGDVGMGTQSPGAALHVNRTSGTASIHVTDTGGSGPLQMVRLENDGAVQLYMDNTSNASAQWMFSAGASMLLVPSDNTSDAVFDLSNTGNLTIDGTLTELSDKHAKMAIEPIDTGEILAKVTALPVSSWTYIHDADTGVRHIGPMAQDFYAAFGTGHTDKGIATLDSSGVALAAIQAQQTLIERLSARIETLEGQIAAN